MAASDDEGAQSDNKNDDPALQETSKQFSTIHQEIESQLERPGVSYETRVSAVLSGWERLAGFVHGDISQMQPLATYVYQWSLRLVLQGQWPGLAQIVKTRLAVTLQRCSNVSVLEPLCKTLLPLVSDPWGHQTKTILSDTEISDEEAVNYILNESWEVVRVRVDTMVESRCEKLALHVLRVCVRCIHLQSEGMAVPLYTDKDHNHFVDLYFGLLYKFERKEFVEEVKKLDVTEGVELVRRLGGKQDKLKIWKHRLKIADLAIQIFLATTVVKKYSPVFDLVFLEWCNVQEALAVEDSALIETIHKYIQLSESSKQIYAMAGVLHEKSGGRIASLVTELLIRALTTDMNSLEGIKLKCADDSSREDQLHLEHQMAKGFMDLGSVFTHHKNVARECILTAFSLHPTSDRLGLLSNYINEPSPPPRSHGVDSSVPKNTPLEELRNQMMMGSPVTSLSPQPSSDLYTHPYALNDTSRPSSASPYPSASAPCNDSSDQENSRTQMSVEQVQSSSWCEAEKSENIAVHDSSEVNIQERDGNRDLECHETRNAHSSNDSDRQNADPYSSCTSQLKDPPPKDYCTTDITIDTGQAESCNIFRQDCNESQIRNASSDAQVTTENPSLFHTKESEASAKAEMEVSVSEDNVRSESKSKEDLDSMDKFYKSTESFIKQLRDEPPKKSPVQTSGENHPNYDILTQPNQVLDSLELGLSKELCDDLAVVLSSPRWQVLSWMLERHELLGICERYMNDADSAKNLTKELKYLNIDYDQFKHMPSAEINEFTGIEKGYEHFIDNDSDSELSEGEYHVANGKGNLQHSSIDSDVSELGKRKKKKEQIKKVTHVNRLYESDSDYDSCGRLKDPSRYMVAYSDSDESDCDPKNKTLLLKMDHDGGSTIEGKRVTAVSSQDRSKRIRIDAGTGKIRRDRIEGEHGKVRHERNLLNTLRLFRHKKYKEEPDPKVETKLGGIPRSPGHYAPRLSSLNLNPKIILTERDKSIIDDQIQSGVTTVMAGSKRPAQTCSIPSSQSRGSWIYAGSLVAPPNSANSTRATTPVSVPRSSAASVQCYLRTKDGKVRVAPFNRSLLNNTRPQNPPSGGNTENLKAVNTPTSGYLDSYTKFLLQNNKKSSITLVRKNMTLDASLDYLEKQGTTVTFKSQKGASTLALANAQKNVLNRIMSPENAISAMRGRFNERFPVRAIAMPVSNNVPNMPADKNSPANLSRVLPKGTTVVRKPKADGAGPSGLNNGGGPSGGAVSPRAVITRPGGFSAVVARPSVSVASASLRTGNSIMSVRTSSGTIRTPVSRGIVVSGSSGVHEVAASNSTSSLIVSSSVVTSAAAVGSVTTAMPAPLVSATVVGSVPNINNLSSPLGTLGGSNGQQPWENALDDSVSDSSPCEISVALTQNMSSTRGATTCTTTVASPPGDVRAASMLETLLRDRPIPANPLLSPVTTATTTITSALPQTITSVMGGTCIPITVSGEGQVTSAVMGALANTGSSGNSVVIAGGSSNNSGVIVASGVVGGATGSGVVVASGGVVGNTGVVTAGNSALGGDGGSGAVQQVLVPGQLVQVHTSDGSTGLGIVHSSSLDLRLPAGTRVIKSSSGPVRTTASQQHQIMGVISQGTGRQVNVLHNVKILQNVQNRQIVRTVVVPHSVALQGLGSHQTSHIKPQLLALTQGTSTSTSQTSGSGEATVVQGQGPATTVRAKIPTSTIVQKVLSRGGLVIRTLRPQMPVSQATGDVSAFEEGLGAKLQQQQQAIDDDKSSGNAGTTVVARLPQDEGLGERLSHYLKTALVSSTSTQSVGTQTLTTAVKPSAGQCVNQVAMNHLRGSSSAVVSLTGGVQGISGQSSNTVATSPAPPQQTGLSSLPLTPTNAVSSETLEQLREFESVFEKVSNKSGKDTTDGETSAESYSSPTISSEESMIAAQLLSMANDTPAVTTTSNYVYSVPASMYEAGSTRLTEGTYITIPSSTQAGTLILVNHSGVGTGLVTVAAGGVQSQHPPSAPSPTLSSTSSHSSIASSPSSTSSKNKKQPPKPKVVPPTTPPAVAKPKTPPPPKTPAPKPTVAKPQVEESDETRARIQAILEQYSRDLANTPQPQPAPRNRKNCPPPKSDGKSSNKKKSGIKKVEGSAGNSPAVSEGSIAGCPSPSPSPGPASDSSVGLSGNSSGVASVQYTSQGLTSQGTGTTGGTILTEEKIKTENNIKVETGQEVVATAGPQLLQGVMVSNVKLEGAGGTTSLPQGLAGGRVVQLIRHGGKVTAITTRQPLGKIKTSGQSGPPPNVTIQGRINMNDLMESHIASLLTGGTPTITQSPTVVSKIIHQQGTGHPTVQQVVVQPSAGPQVLQQVSVQQIPSTPPKAHQQQKCGVIQQLAGSEELLGLTTPPQRSLHVNLPTLSTTVLNSTASISSAVTLTNTQTIVNSPVIMNTSGSTSGPSPLSVPPSSPLTPQALPVTSPIQAVAASPHTLSPANEQPPTPSSFQMGEESNSSEQSVGDGSGPLPPFFTLKSFIMQPQTQQQKQRSQGQQSQQQEQQTGHDKSFSPGTVGEQNFTSTVTQAVSSVISSPVNKPQRGSQTHIHLHHSQHPRKPASVIRTGGASGRILVGGTAEGFGKSLGHGNLGSLMLSGGTVDTAVPMSPMSGSSSLESSPATTHSRIRLASRPQDMRSSSIDSLKSDLSVEEVQIPPSPATLTKQLQSAYMTEAALSPSVSQSQHSGSSYSSPGTTHDLPFTEAPPTSEDSFSATLAQPGCSSVPSGPGLSVTGVTLEGDGGLAALTSPSGDIYLHQSGSSLGLEGLEVTGLPLAMEVRTHSPALSDLVSSGPLLTWSPRSADSMMAQSPSLNDALTANIPLDGNHSEDSLCDSSTGFPGLFSIEGDGVSVSSSTSEDMPVASLNQQHQHQERQESIEITIDLTPEEGEQDHTITSTRSPTQLELSVANMRGVLHQGSVMAMGVLSSPMSQDTPWRFENTVGNQNTHHSPEHAPGSQDEKPAIKHEDSAGPSDVTQDRFRSSLSRSHEKIEKLKEQHDIRLGADSVPNQTVKKDKRSCDLLKKTDRGVDVKRNSTISDGNKKRSHRLQSMLEGRNSSLQNELGVVDDEVSTKNGHDDETDVIHIKAEDSSVNVAKNKRRSSQRTTVVYPSSVVQSTACRNRSKPVKSEDIKDEEDADSMETFVKEEKPIKNDKDCKEGCEEGMMRLKEGCEETLGRTTRGSKRRSEGDAIADLKRGRGTRSGRRSDGDVLKTEEELVNHLEEECTLSRTLRGRHISGASDTSSNYSMERALTPGLHDFPTGIGSSRRRRRLSRESSASSRDGSPTLLHTHDFSPGGVNTRRSSSRDHAKKKKCSCCVGGDQKKKSGPGGSNSSSRRSSSRATRASHSGTLQ